MKRNFLLSVSLMTLAACSQPAPTTQASAATDTATPAPEATPCVQTGYQILPDGVRLDMSYHLRADRFRTTPDGQARRRIVLEYLDGDHDAVLQSVEASLANAGFTARPPKAQPNGNIARAFAKKGYGNIIVVANPSPGDNPSDPAAKGTVTLDYPADDKATVPFAETSN